MIGPRPRLLRSSFLPLTQGARSLPHGENSRDAHGQGSANAEDGGVARTHGRRRAHARRSRERDVPIRARRGLRRVTPRRSDGA
uniref:Uncharacterized protein n=1 Tax=Hyaloperonospora arabidopsidis (strain Emoy2) TaxID=559515 RepID=M4BK80_HYAAE